MRTRVVLIGGTSNVGKSTVARAVADRLGAGYRSTDSMARHPGRPWASPGWEVPAHVVDHYRSHSPDELVVALLEHYERLWPRVAELVTDRATGDGDATGLVLEGSGLWPDRVAALTVPCTAAVWLTADPAVVRARVCAAAGYAGAPEERRYLIDQFLARTERYQERMLDAVRRLGLARIDVGVDRPVEDLADEVLAVAAAQRTVGARVR